MKKNLSIGLALVFSIFLINNNINADSVSINDLFKDDKFASVIATKLGKTVDDTVVQDELDTITGASIIVGAGKLESLEGIGYLKNLRGLIVSGSKVSEIPEEITKVTNLAQLEIDGSELSTIPDSINTLNKLEKISFTNNKITDLPDSLKNLSALKTLDLSGNLIESLDTKMVNVSSLNLSTNKLSEVSDNIASISSMEILDLRNNSLSSLNLKLDNLTNLKELYVSNNKITSIVPQIILKAGLIDKYSMDNHTQYANLETLNIYSDQQVNSEVLLPDLLKQIKSDSANTLAGFGSWSIKKPDNTTQIILAADGSEITSTMFNTPGTYVVEFYSTNKQQRYWGYSSFTRTVNVIDNIKPTISADKNITIYENDSNSISNLSYDVNHTFKYEIKDTSILSYENNVLKGLKVGSTTVDVWVNDGYSDSEKITITVSVKQNPTISIKDEITEINVSENQKINLLDYLNISQDTTLNILIEDESIIKIDNNLTKAITPVYLKALKSGTTNVSLSVSDGTKTSSIINLKVNVKKAVSTDNTTNSPVNQDSTTNDKTNNNNNSKLPSTGTSIIFLLIVALSTGTMYSFYNHRKL